MSSSVSPLSPLQQRLEVARERASKDREPVQPQDLVQEEQPDFKVQGVYELQGGIERYLKTFPAGGHWKGKNYLFDRRREQVAEHCGVAQALKDQAETEAEVKLPSTIPKAAACGVEVTSKCAWCRRPWNTYIGKFKCCGILATGFPCAVPVILCSTCAQVADGNKSEPGKPGDPAGCRMNAVKCELCLEGYRAPPEVEQRAVLKRTADGGFVDLDATSTPTKKPKTSTSRVFIRKLPFVVNATQLRAAVHAELCKSGIDRADQVEIVHWLTDRKSGLFYGSAMLNMRSADAASAVARQGRRVL